MFERLEELTGAMRVYSTGFDASLLSCAEAQVVTRQAASLEHMAATIKSLAAARAAEARAWKEGGYRSAEEHLAQSTGTSLADAREALALGRRLGGQPDVADAARQGRLSPTQAAAISDAVAADPSAAAGLLGTAEAGGSLADLKDQCAQVKAGTADLEQRRAAIRRRRALRAWTDDNGEWHFTANGNPEEGAQIMAAIGPLADQSYHQARAQGRHEHPDAYRFDALVQLAVNATTPTTDHRADDNQGQDSDDEPPTAQPAHRGNTGDHTATPGPPAAANPPPEPQPADTRARVGEADTGLAGGVGPPNAARPDAPAAAPPAGAPTKAPPGGRPPRRGGRNAPRARRGAPVKLLLRVDLDAFLRGFPTNGETCELAGYGSISMTAVRDILKDGDPFVAAILTKSRQLQGVAHLGRKPTAHQKSAIEWLYPTCAVQGCPHKAHLETDHRADWAQTHFTLIDWLDALCHHHHALKTRDGWALIDGTGKRAFVAPAEPRHPRHPRHHNNNPTAA